jgi:hypothetical protein
MHDQGAAGEEDSSPTIFSSICLATSRKKSSFDKGLLYTFNRCPFTTKEFWESSMVLILTSTVIENSFHFVRSQPSHCEFSFEGFVFGIKE